MAELAHHRGRILAGGDQDRGEGVAQFVGSETTRERQRAALFEQVVGALTAEARMRLRRLSLSRVVRRQAAQGARPRTHVYPKALVIAYGVHESGRREVIGLNVGELESGAFWAEFLRELRGRGLAGVRLCVSDEHQGLKGAIRMDPTATGG